MGVFSSAVFSNNSARFLKFGDAVPADFFCRPLLGSEMQKRVHENPKSKSEHLSNNIFRLSLKPKKNVHFLSHITSDLESDLFSSPVISLFPFFSSKIHTHFLESEC